MVDVVLRTNMSSRYQTLADTHHHHATSDSDRHIHDANLLPVARCLLRAAGEGMRTDEGTKFSSTAGRAFEGSKAIGICLMVLDISLFMA